MLIGFCGKKYSGKDTSADFLTDNYGFKKYAFATPLKNVVKEIFDLSDDQLYTNKKEEVDVRYNWTPRKMLEFIGTDVMRKTFGDDFWVNKIKNQIIQNINNNIPSVISDVRFQSEIDMIKQLGGVVIKINRIDNQNLIYSDIETNIDLLECDYKIDNNNSIVEFYKNLDMLVDSIINKVTKS